MSFETRILPKGNCAVCQSLQQLLTCSACKVIKYCGRDHQTAHRPTHKKACTNIKKTALALAAEDQKLRTPQPDEPFKDYFKNDAGHFWGVQETRPYMRARMMHVETLLDIKTFEAVEAVLGHVMDLHRLCRKDNMGVRNITPHVLIRVGKDQECYDFLKWYATIGLDPKYDWADTKAPLLDTKDADMFEAVDVFVAEDRSIDLSHLLAVTLLKIRLLARVKNSADVGDKQTDSDAQIQLLDTQIDQLFRKVRESNKSMWPAILVPQHDLGVQPEFYQKGGRGEMQVVLRYAYDAWKETPDAIPVVFQKMIAFAGADKEILKSG